MSIVYGKLSIASIETMQVFIIDIHVLLKVAQWSWVHFKQEFLCKFYINVGPKTPYFLMINRTFHNSYCFMLLHVALS